MSSSQKQALEDLLREFRADPDGYEINKKIGVFMSRIRKYQLHAGPHLIKALSYKIKDHDAKHLLDGLAHFYNLTGSFDAAAMIYETAVQACPEISDFAFRRGDASFRSGKAGESSDIFRAAIDRLNRSARANSQSKGGPLVHLLEPRQVICRFFCELAAKIDLYVKARELGYIDSARAILIAPDGDVCNPCLLDYWKKYITVVSAEEEIADCLSEYAENAVFLDYYTVADGRTLHRDLAHRAINNRWEEEGRPPLLVLKDSDRERGWRRLRSAGVADGSWLVALHVREAGFFDEDVAWSTNKFRNARIETYFPAIEEIVGRGGWVIRLGDPSMTPLPAMPNVIDYAHSDLRSDWMDIFLIAESRFYLGMASGPSSAAVAFGVPTVGTNWFHLGPWPYCRNDIFIHKLLKSTADGRILSIAESLKPPLFGALEPLFFKARGLEPVDNTADEIREACVEMLDRMDGKLTYSDEDERLQALYRKQADPFSIPIRSRLCAAFLKRHPELIGI